MKSLKVVLSADARADLKGVRDYHRRVAGPTVAARMTQKLREALVRIGRTPYVGAPRPQYGANMRLRYCAPYVLYLDVSDTRVEVVRILHASRDRDAIMASRDEDV